MRNIIELALLVQLDEDAAVQRHHLNVKWIIINNLLEDLVSLLKVLIIEILLSLYKPDVERFLLVQQIQDWHHGCAHRARSSTLPFILLDHGRIDVHVVSIHEVRST